MDEKQGQLPASLLPYDEWTETALRQVMLRALEHAGAHGLPGGHHFYVTFRTDHPNTMIPARMRAQYPQEMTIVLQHQFWDLKVNEAAAEFSVGLSFGGVPTTIHIPFGAITAFADPAVSFGLQFRVQVPAEAPPVLPQMPAEDAPAAVAPPAEPQQVVSLDAFRRRSPPKE